MSRFDKLNFHGFISILLFLLPIFTVTLRHWLSSIFGILAILSLVYLFKRKKQTSELERDERILLWAFGAYFFIFVLTSLINGWGELQTRYLGVEIRFLLFIPLYLLIRQQADSLKWFFAGCIIGLVVTFIDSVYEVYIQDARRYFSVYGPLFSGPVTALIAIAMLPYLGRLASIKHQILLCIILALAIVPVVFTDARSTYFTVPILIIIAFLNTKGTKQFILPLCVILCSALLYLTVERVSKRVDYAYAEFSEYMAMKDPVRATYKLTSTGVRLEMWRVTPRFIEDNPVFGIGRGNYVNEVGKYIDARQAHKDIAQHSHPHNIYSEAIISKGIIGLLSFLGITLLPLGMLIRDFKNHSGTAIYGIILITGFLLYSTTDASAFIKGNFTALYVLSLSIFFSHHKNSKQQLSE